MTGGLLAQTRDLGMVARADLKVVTKRTPGAAELEDLFFAWQVCKYEVQRDRTRATAPRSASAPGR
ncbi:MAG: hypothetical protein U1F11_05140 [Steroidobacteraceae bacterium]